MARLRDPVFWTQAIQLLKTAAAAVIAWLLAKHVFHIAQPFLAPWAALLTVHATVYRTFRRGAQQVGATVVGVLLAFAAGAALGVNAVSLGLAVLLALAAGAAKGLRSESTTAAATALVVLTTGYSNDSHLLLARLLDTGIGIAVGVLVNLLVWPPLRDRSAAAHVDAIDDELGGLLCDIARALRDGCPPETADDWIARTRELNEEIDRAAAVVGQARESGRLNPRRAARARMKAIAQFDAILERLEQAVSETRSMARTIRLERVPPADWDPAFREPWLALLERTGAAIAAADVEAMREVGAAVDEWDEEQFWPVSGALVVNLRNILHGFDEVAAAQPVRVPAPALSRH
jgi:uncharacterized membrane protein YgaE (UPF0421/DUF939 family)